MLITCCWNTFLWADQGKLYERRSMNSLKKQNQVLKKIYVRVTAHRLAMSREIKKLHEDVWWHYRDRSRGERIYCTVHQSVLAAKKLKPKRSFWVLYFLIYKNKTFTVFHMKMVSHDENFFLTTGWFTSHLVARQIYVLQN